MAIGSSTDSDRFHVRCKQIEIVIGTAQENWSSGAHHAAGSTRDRPLLRRDLGFFGPYRALEKLAGGGMAEIFKVERADGAKGVYALKLIRGDRAEEQEFRQMLMDEARIARHLRHPNIARVLELHEESGELGLILEYVDGIDLIRAQRLITDRGLVLPLASAILVLIELLGALDFAHNVTDGRGEALNIVHRDVSPGNVMLDLGGRVRVVDWGIARAKNRIAQTEAGHVKGKFRYMAPEQITGQTVTPRTDVYSAAITFWELIAGMRIYDALDLPKMMLKVSRADIPALASLRPDIPPALTAVFKKATARDPLKRFASARAFREELEGLGLVADVSAAREWLRRVTIGARITDLRRHYERSLRHVQTAPRGADLERILVRALEHPDRVLAADLRDLRRAQSVAPGPGSASLEQRFEDLFASM